MAARYGVALIGKEMNGKMAPARYVTYPGQLRGYSIGIRVGARWAGGGGEQIGGYYSL